MKNRYLVFMMLMTAFCFLTSCEKDEMDGPRWTLYEYIEFDFKDFTTEMYDTLKQNKTMVIQSKVDYRLKFGESTDIDFAKRTLLLGTAEFPYTVKSFMQTFYKNENEKYIYKINATLNPPQTYDNRIYYGIIVNKVSNNISFEVETEN